MQNGVIGWYGEAEDRYVNYISMFSMSTDKAKPFKQVFPLIEKMRHLGKVQEVNLYNKWMATKAVLRSKDGV